MDKDLGVAADAAAPSAFGSSPVPGLDASHSVTNAQRDLSTPTPGPWSFEHDPSKSESITLQAEGDPCFAQIDPFDGELTARDFANARLIAAAPDMLAALQTMVAYSDRLIAEGHYTHREPRVQELYDMCAAAIAKAEGRQ